MENFEPDFYENNDRETLAIVGHSDLGLVAVFDSRENSGLFLRSNDEARYVRDALSRWLGEGGAPGKDDD